MAEEKKDDQCHPDYKRMSNIISSLLYGEVLSTEAIEAKAKENGIEIIKQDA